MELMMSYQIIAGYAVAIFVASNGFEVSGFAAPICGAICI
jgi:hypothetical protein